MVMTPEPFGEAFDALGDRRRDRRGADAVRDAVQPGAGPRAGGPRAAGLPVRPLRGHRPAGARPRRDPRRGASRSRSATTCSTAARWPRWRSPRPWSGCCPGFMGNAESLVEESHEDGLLEYPVYTRPASWRGLDVPAGAAVGRPRARSRPGGSSRRGGVRRSDGRTCCTPAPRPPTGRSCRRRPGDAGELLTLQRACWVQEALANDSLADIPALHESLDDVLGWMRHLVDLGGAQRGPARRRGARPARGRPGGRGTSAGSWWPPTCRAAAWAGRCWPTSRRSPRPRRRRTSCSPGPGAPTTSGCTRRPATGSGPTSRRRRSRSS